MSNPLDEASKRKDPDAVLDYFIDWSSWLAEGDTITAAAWAITGPDLALTQAAGKPSTVDGGRCTVWLEGGTEGKRYSATCHITTAQGREDDRTLTINVIQR